MCFGQAMKELIRRFLFLLQCDAALGIKAFLDMLYKKPGKRLMVFGSACTEVTGPIAQASQFLHLAQVSFN